jgi:hypothetical protein
MKHLISYLNFISEGEFYQESLNPKFWKDERFDPEIREKLLSIANDFYKDLEVDTPILDIQLTGSLANYNWTKYSDLDVHVILDLSKVNEDISLVKKAMDGIRFMWNQRHPVVIREHDVELYAQDMHQLHLASGLYSLLNDEWIRKPQYTPPTVDSRDVERKVEAYGHEIEEAQRMLDQADPENARIVMSYISALKKKISRSRDEQLAKKGGEFSVENLVFKRMRNNGMYGKTHSEESKDKLKAKAKGRFTLDWYKEKNGDVEGERLYEERRVWLKSRNLKKDENGRFLKAK